MVRRYYDELQSFVPEREAFALTHDNVNIIFSDTDRLILESFKCVIDGLSEYLGEGYEIVLHSLESLDHSVVKIVNGHHTGRKEGAPITNLALSMLTQITGGEGNNSYSAYEAVNNKGEPLRSTTILVRGEYDRVIGLLCINFYLNTPLSHILSTFMGQASSVPTENHLNEDFSENVDDMINKAIEQAHEAVDKDRSILPSNKNREIVQRLNNWGIFRIKDAVSKVADNMGISKNTVYLHLRYARKTEI
ncbi:MAG: PAS domain-containing protein [Oscillospiraceae bacterium]